MHGAPGADRRQAFERDQFGEIALGGGGAGPRQVGVFAVGHTADESFGVGVEHSVECYALPCIERVLGVLDPESCLAQDSTDHVPALANRSRELLQEPFEPGGHVKGAA